ncbi:hypothetical protein ACFLS1_02710 [Verrucomicrobiota bacterium]
MICKNVWYGGILVAIAIISVTAGWADEKVKETSADVAKSEAAEAAKYARRATISRDMAMNAVVNAMAAQDDVEDDLIKAMKANDRKKIDVTKKALESASKEAKEAREIAEQVIEYAGKSISAANMAKEEAKSASDAEEIKRNEPDIKAVRHQVIIAGKMAAKAEALTETLKKRWLIPVMPPKAAAAASSTVAETQSSVTPVGKK